MRGVRRSVEVGLFLAPDATAYVELREQARIADEAGIELIVIQIIRISRGSWTRLL
jgi:hypothetical protein